MNLCIFCGRVVDTPVINTTGEGKKVARYRMAVDSEYANANGERDANFISCVCFGKSAEFVEQHVGAGDKFIIHCSVKTGDYTNKDGQKIFTTDFVVSRHEFAETKAEKERRLAAKQSAQPAQSNPA